jgi:hypothetical protein
VDDARRRLRAVLAHQRVEVGAVEVLDRVVEDPVRRAPVVEDRDRVGVREPRGELDLALEALERGRPRPVGPQQLDRGRPPQHRVAGAVGSWMPIDAACIAIDRRIWAGDTGSGS